MKQSKLISWLVGVGLIVSQTSAGLAMEAPTLTIVTPNGGEIWSVGTTQTISWDNGGFELVDIAYTTTGSEYGPWTDIATDVDAHSNYSWLVPNTPTTTALLRLYGHFSYGGPERFVYGTGTFSIVNPDPVPTWNLMVTTPNGGEFYKIGTAQIIRWISKGIGNNERIRVELDRGNGKWKTVGITRNSGVMPWRVTGPKTNTALIRISLVKNSKVKDISDRFFRISNK
ncbi:hypothetical protein A2810_02155 [candidate division Kazan bacterium RIFCSPHIGHO2_01_FULL_49_10]|uniref:Uncharacterized protein n=1 Tax=candidate division Kazan bacterium RIFCSPLOWO2_01_FULL_48_13 TaxID=1798539 RepID=A0A1F4PMS1_UNCK3|nr:MAG: hypothetical protein A2810_02155 [candidate division Kazan bacterium RIFCSPHIGHO2_01_FULL_49_10]OGB84981.1 MAG: hypothetical protein A2994_01340 [candidate division Kazan bacterium RIFCSPLOWO2_01_FULL_48_13]